MYNRYLASAATPPPPVHSQPQQQQNEPFSEEPSRHEEPPCHEHSRRDPSPPQNPSVFGDLTKMLSGRLHGIKLDMDTILVLVIAWFLLSDGDEIDWDLLVTIGALLIFGV